MFPNNNSVTPSGTTISLEMLLLVAHTYITLLGIVRFSILFSSILTYFIPSGKSRCLRLFFLIVKSLIPLPKVIFSILFALKFMLFMLFGNTIFFTEE